jgi:hypothetical protein
MVQHLPMLRAIGNFLACLLSGHIWAVLRHNERKTATRGHLHTLAGVDADCKRCGKQWRDA